jgi:hypothetical protein
MSYQQDDTEEFDDDDDLYPTRMPTSARRYQMETRAPLGVMTQQPRKRVVRVHDFPLRRSRTQGYPPLQGPPAQPPPLDPPSQTRTRPRVHWVLFVGIGMLVMVFVCYLLSVCLTWWQITQDDWHYGRPRTYQVDARVGHSDSVMPSHFTVINLNRHVIVIELPGADPARAKIYLGPTLSRDGQDLTPVTLSFKDVNGDGQPDMLIHIQDQTIVFLNENGAFRPLKAGEHVTL